MFHLKSHKVRSGREQRGRKKALAAVLGHTAGLQNVKVNLKKASAAL